MTLMPPCASSGTILRSAATGGRCAAEAEHPRDRVAPDVGVEHADLLALGGERRGEVGGQRRLADAALAGADAEDVGDLRPARRSGSPPPRPSFCCSAAFCWSVRTSKATLTAVTPSSALDGVGDAGLEVAADRAAGRRQRDHDVDHAAVADVDRAHHVELDDVAAQLGIDDASSALRICHRGSCPALSQTRCAVPPCGARRRPAHRTRDGAVAGGYGPATDPRPALLRAAGEAGATRAPRRAPDLGDRGAPASWAVSTALPTRAETKSAWAFASAHERVRRGRRGRTAPRSACAAAVWRSKRVRARLTSRSSWLRAVVPRRSNGAVAASAGPCAAGARPSHACRRWSRSSSTVPTTLSRADSAAPTEVRTAFSAASLTRSIACGPRARRRVRRVARDCAVRAAPRVARLALVVVRGCAVVRSEAAVVRLFGAWPRPSWRSSSAWWPRPCAAWRRRCSERSWWRRQPWIPLRVSGVLLEVSLFVLGRYPSNTCL